MRRNQTMGGMKVLAVVLTGLLVLVVSSIVALQGRANTEKASAPSKGAAYTAEPTPVVSVTPLPSIVLIATQEPVEDVPAGIEDDTPFTLQIADSVSIELGKVPDLPFASAPSYVVRPKKVDDERIVRYLWGDQENAVTKEKSGDTVMYSSTDGRQLSSSDLPASGYNDKMIYSTPLYDALTYMRPFHEELNDMSNYFQSEGELDFMTREAAVQKAMEVADILGVSVMPTARVVTLDAASLNSAQRELEKSELWSSERSSMRKKYGKSWTLSDEAYAVVLEPSIGGIPISNYFNKTSEETPQFPTYITVYIYRSGIAGIEASGLYEAVQTEPEKPLIGFDEMLEQVQRYYDQFITTDARVYERAALQLVPSLQRGAFRLTPMWVLTGSDGVSGNTDARSFDNHVFLRRLLVNAYDGQVVVNR